MTQGPGGTLRAVPIPMASCPVTEAMVRVDPAWTSGTVVDAPCGHRHRATFEFGSWVLEAA